LRILICHNYYARRSGECAVVDQEAALLREKGHDVEQFSYDNADFLGFRFSERTKAGFRAIYSTRTDRDIRRFLLGKTFEDLLPHFRYVIGRMKTKGRLACSGSHAWNSVEIGVGHERCTKVTQRPLKASWIFNVK